METLLSTVSTVFVTLSIGVLLFFLHKVIWLLQYKRVQGAMLRAAEAELKSARADTLPDWDKFAAAAWRVARGPSKVSETAAIDGPSPYVKAVEEELGAVLSELEQSQVAVRPLLVEALSRDREQPPRSRVVLQVPDRRDGSREATIHLDPPLVDQPTPPPEELYTLNVKSRYGFVRRALVFFAGLADVVYSSHHIATMSQYSHVPVGVIVRRLSLVVLLVVGIVFEVVLGLRDKLAPVLDEHLIRGRAWVAHVPEGMQDSLPTTMAMVLWTGTVAAIYFSLYLVIRRGSRQHYLKLQRLKDQQEERLARIRRHHLKALSRWAQEYGDTIDAAVALTARHVQMLGRHYAQRVRRRMCGRALHDQAEGIAAILFAQLPEATGELADAVTTTKHSLRHMIWPRPDEMVHIVKQAQYREAWQHIELTLNELLRGQPDPDGVAAFWRRLVTYAVTFSDVLAEGAIDELRRAYLTLVERTSEQTERDLERFARSVRELLDSLNEQLAPATPLLTARIELCNQRIRADAAAFQAEIIRARERARLEAMAFEI
jgi:hypothetical protein